MLLAQDAPVKFKIKSNFLTVTLAESNIANCACTKLTIRSKCSFGLILIISWRKWGPKGLFGNCAKNTAILCQLTMRVLN